MYAESPAIAPCSICSNHFHTDELAMCATCCDLMYEGCVSSACSCVHEDPEIREIRDRIRVDAIELGQLRTIASLMGLEGLTELQQARLVLLIDVVTSLRNEDATLGDIRDGDDWSRDEDSVD